jgi:hypothetical protein
MLQRIPLWLYFPTAALLLWTGLVVMSTLMTDSADTERAELLRQAPLWVLVLVPLVEALVWTVAFVELAAYFHAAAIGAVMGVAAYSLLVHSGFWGIIVSAWIGGVLNATYLLMRGRSRLAAAANAIALRWAFIVYAYFTVATHASAGAS